MAKTLTFVGMKPVKIVNVSSTARYGILDVSNWKDGPKRETEAIAVKEIIRLLLNNGPFTLAYQETGKPYLKDQREKISISHSHDKVVVLLDEEKETGIDIELIRDKILNVSHKFISDEEKKNVANDDVEKLLVYWACKEALYKIYGRKKVDFREHLYIEPFNYNAEIGGIVNGHIRMPDLRVRYMLHYEKLENYILVYLI